MGCVSSPIHPKQPGALFFSPLRITSLRRTSGPMDAAPDQRSLALAPALAPAPVVLDSVVPGLVHGQPHQRGQARNLPGAIVWSGSDVLEMRWLVIFEVTFLGDAVNVYGCQWRPFVGRWFPISQTSGHLYQMACCWRRDGTFVWDETNGSSRSGWAVMISGSQTELGGCHERRLTGAPF